MKNFYQSYDAAITSEEKELVVKKALRQVIHVDQRKEWERILADRYGVEKKEKKEVNSTRLYWLKAVSVAASLAALIFIGNQYLNQSQTIQVLAQEYLVAVPVHHPGLIKGMSQHDEQNRQIAISLFDSQKYAGAIDKFNEITDQSYQDQFYLGLSYMYFGEMESAIPLFVELENKTSQYREEINWFLSLAYILNEDQKNAKKQLKKIKSGDWNYQKSKTLSTKLK